MLRGGIGPGVELVEIEDGCESLDRLVRDGHAGAAELAQGRWGNQPDQQAEDCNDDQNLEQGEPRISPGRCLATGYTMWDRIDPTMSVPFAACMALVAQIYALPPRVLPSIQKVEGGWPGAVILNRNGSEDLGVMQVNAIWLPTLQRYTGLSEATIRERLIHRPCFNIAAAGLIMRTYLDETRGDLMQAVGNYHSHTPVYHNSYRVRVIGAARVLFQNPARR